MDFFNAIILGQGSAFFPLIGPFLGTLGAFLFQGWRHTRLEKRQHLMDLEYALHILTHQEHVLTKIWTHNLSHTKDMQEEDHALFEVDIDYKVPVLDLGKYRFLLYEKGEKLFHHLFECHHQYMLFISLLKTRQSLSPSRDKTKDLRLKVNKEIYKHYEEAKEENQKAQKSVLEHIKKRNFL